MQQRFLPLLALGGILAAGCGPTVTQHAVTAAARPNPSPSPSPSPSPTVKPSPRPLDPLTGLPAGGAHPVVIVKVDNATTARRYQRGLGSAAIVYQELVESGQTRFAAVFDNGYSGEVGPIRSLRESDVELFPEYGRVSVAFSGGNTGVKATFHAAVRAGKLLDASYDAMPGRYRLGERRPDARNFFARPARLGTGAAARDIGLRFGPTAAGRPATSASVHFSGQMGVQVRYVASTGHWAVLQDGVEMGGVAPSNVIVQYVTVRAGRYRDVLGAPSPYTVSLGSGNAVVLRDGRAITATWQRATTRGGTRYLDAAGRDVRLRPGATWILLVPRTVTASIG